MGAVTGYQFWVADGVANTATVMDPSGDAAVNPSITTLYRTNWQGKKRLYSTARTNLLIRSKALANASWSKFQATIGASTTGPDGVASMEKITEQANTALHHIRSATMTLTSGQPYIISGYLKAGERTYAVVQGDSAGGFLGAAVTFNLANGTVSSANGMTATITPAPNGSYFVTIAATATGVTAGLGIGMRATSGTGFESYLGNGTNGIYATDFQVELGTAATSRIRTDATAVSVTDYSLANNTLTFAEVPPNRSLFEWTGTDSNSAPARRVDAGAISGFGTMGAR